MLCVLATIDVAEGRRDEFLIILRALVPKVLAEEGCLEYGPMIDLETNLPAQPAARENTVVIVEKWTSVAALEAHLMAPHMLDYRKAVKDLVLGMSLEVLVPA
ncbi:MAG: antibiotic biosynthesis monooxygenase [Candidatus Lokiarchaeota archaeon]|nr:antibiotic biosynthesis monooxygenase [Candidatus Lokiarchaeota archaeon]